MARFTLVLSAATIVGFLPGGFAGPACARRNWKSEECVARCAQRWGYPGAMMGTDPWGSVVQAISTEVWDKYISDACGVESPPSVTFQGGIQTSAEESSTSPTSTSTTSSSTSSEVTTTNEVEQSTTSSTPPPAPTTSEEPSSTSSEPPPPETTSEPPPPPETTAEPPPPSETTTEPPPPETTTAQASPTPTPSESAPPENQKAGSGSSVSSTGGDIDEFLKAHNDVRDQHGAVRLTWNDEAAAKAQQWANGCVHEHSGGSLGAFGENLAAGSGGSFTISSAVKSWTDEVKDYNPDDPQASHFTQVVWKSTTQVGCATQSCDGIFDASFGKALFVVCEYTPQGNVIGAFAENVQA